MSTQAAADRLHPLPSLAVWAQHDAIAYTEWRNIHTAFIGLCCAEPGAQQCKRGLV